MIGGSEPAVTVDGDPVEGGVTVDVVVVPFPAVSDTEQDAPTTANDTESTSPAARHVVTFGRITWIFASSGHDPGAGACLRLLEPGLAAAAVPAGERVPGPLTGNEFDVGGQDLASDQVRVLPKIVETLQPHRYPV